MSLIGKLRFLSGNHNFISALERTIELFEGAEDSDWSNLSVNEVNKILKNELSKINQNHSFDKLELAVLYAPASNIQEIAMTNGWHKEYLKIPKIIDRNVR